jgi:hypothetical protein
LAWAAARDRGAAWLRESCKKSKGFSCGRVWALTKKGLCLPFTIPWNMCDTVLVPYRRWDDKELGVNGHAKGLRRVERRYAQRRYCLCGLLLTVLVLSVLIPTLVILGQCRACEDQPVRTPPEQVSHFFSTVSKSGACPRVALIDGLTVQKPECIRATDYLERVHVSLMRGTVTVRVNASSMDQLRIDVEARANDDETLNYVISSVEQYKGRVVNVSAYWDELGFHEQQNIERTKAERAAAEAEAAGAAGRRQLKAKGGGGGGGGGGDGDGGEGETELHESFMGGPISLTRCPSVAITVWLPNATLVSPPALDITIGEIGPPSAIGWGSAGWLESWVPGLVEPLGEVDVDLEGGALSSLRVFNPVGGVALRRARVGQVTLDTSVGTGAVQVRGVSAGALRVLAGSGDVHIEDSVLPSPLAVRASVHFLSLARLSSLVSLPPSLSLSLCVCLTCESRLACSARARWQACAQEAGDPAHAAAVAYASALEDQAGGDRTADPPAASSAAGRRAITRCLTERSQGFAGSAQMRARGFAPPFAQPVPDGAMGYEVGGAAGEDWCAIRHRLLLLPPLLTQELTRSHSLPACLSVSVLN